MEGRGCFQQNIFTHMLLANLSASYPKLWLFLSLAVTCLVRHMACSGCCIFTAGLGILGHRMPKQTEDFSSHPLHSSQLSVVVLSFCGTASQTPMHLSSHPFLISAWIFFHHIFKLLFITSFLRQWWAQWMESVNTKITLSSYPD